MKAIETREPTIAVLLPCYNEEHTIGDVVSRFRAALPAARIYVYDNNSRDLTALKARAAGATILHSHFHHFSPNGGVSGVVVLAESHISIHTWPERNFAALDVFMCGDAKPAKTVPVLRRFFRPRGVQINEHKRGIF